MSELRVRKVQEFIKQEVSSMLLHDLKDPRIGFVTVTGVEVTGDLREAKIFVSLFGKDEEKAASLEALNRGKGFIRRELGQRLQDDGLGQAVEQGRAGRARPAGGSRPRCPR